jgi:hypothetical protein
MRSGGTECKFVRWTWVNRDHPQLLVFVRERMELQTFAGITLAVTSFALVVLARLQLGKSFAVAPKANDLVTQGLYSRLRHPMYLFVDLTVCGIALAVHRRYVLLLLIILLHPQRSIRIECPSQNSARRRCSILACSGPSGGFTECLKNPTASTPIRLSSHARGRHSDSWMLIRQFHNRVENNW